MRIKGEKNLLHFLRKQGEELTKDSIGPFSSTEIRHPFLLAGP
jgi:hypothetical protein